jgi:hypothetical protein
LLSFVIILAWLKLLEPLSDYFKGVFVLVDTMNEMGRKLLAGMFPVLLIVYFAWGLAKYTLFSDTDWNHRTVAASIYTLYPDILGEFQWGSEYNRNDPVARSVLIVFTLRIVFSVIVVIVMLNLLISILNDEYDRVKKEANEHWCMYQARTLWYRHRDQQEREERERILARARALTVAAPLGACSCGENEPKLAKLDDREELFERARG